MKKHIALLAIAMPLTTSFAAEPVVASPHPALIPAPAKIEWREGVCREGVLHKDGLVRMDRVAGLPTEGYEIEVAPTGAVLRSSADAGAFYAVHIIIPHFMYHGWLAAMRRHPRRATVCLARIHARFIASFPNDR